MVDYCIVGADMHGLAFLPGVITRGGDEKIEEAHSSMGSGGQYPLVWGEGSASQQADTPSIY